ncbi:hypothetical protein [Methylorubrum extorquens]|uniref:hypothetical protein n=1 Tax=Methylorubrum extorquens TaxID=408 RepID=UPI00209E5BF6|nr:hypothetical protein [Methylorubrum extorquens]MCP1540064.1 hypothetical protein [Methylorubrum extorquens]
MKNLPAGIATTLTVPFQNASGVAVTPTGIIVTVLDEDGRILHGPEIPTASLEDEELVYVVPAAANVLAPGEAVGVRTLEVELTTADGAFDLRHSYMIRAALRLRHLVNSFATYERLLVVAEDLPRLDAWVMAEQSQREPALIEAYNRLTRFGYRVYPAGYDDGDEVNFNAISGPIEHVAPREWQAMTPDDFERFNPQFRKALARAQVQEANAILTVGTAEDHRASGLLSKTTGESSAMFRSGKPLDLGVSRETLEHLSGFIEIRARISRS